VRVSNADNGGNGVTGLAVFDYSQLVGNALRPGQESGARAIKFSNPNTVLFTFTARVIAHVPASSGGSGGVTPTPVGPTGGTTTATSGSGGAVGGLLGGTSGLLRVTVNPLTKSVSVSPLR
jgi:hypothetical protein